MSIVSVESNQLSTFRTTHRFECYGEFKSAEEFMDYCRWADRHGAKVYILGNGSNTLFTRSSVRSLVLKNSLPKTLEPLPDYRLRVSSTVQINEVLNYCGQNSFDSFYYLASVPASIGGALAMNAGRGKLHSRTIYDFVESVTFLENGEVKTLANEQITRSYRQTVFTGMTRKLILSAVLQFSPADFASNPLQERRQWAKEHQDNTLPNCGTVFKSACYPIMDRLRGLRIGEAWFSSKTSNWILNKSKSSTPIVTLITITKILHLMALQKVELEVISVD
ncbi:FAD-binding protein [Gloeobacter violaceus]|uniref:FAD-binding protein n=1 Tax=Gloeobacter violaceus TaxID=33072 RepID=UPI001E617BEC|nr:FAD-binding protein [Gloeobacter violaceus]